MLDQYILSLASDYLDLIRAMRSGDYHGYQLYVLSSQRSGCLDELLRVLGDERPLDMAAYCRQLVTS